MLKSAFSTTEIEQLRADTPGAAGLIHFNNAGSSLPTTQVLQAITGYLNQEAVMGGYEAEAAMQQQLDDTYTLIARLINAQSNEIALVENASAAWCIAFYGIDFKAGDEVLISELEYVTNMVGYLNARKLYGIELKVIPNGADGNFSLANLEAAITSRTRLIAVTHVASATGGVLPAEAIGEIARSHGILYLLDACQSVGHLPVDVESIGCDFLSVTGRKYLRAPRGTGFLYVRKSVQQSLKTYLVDGHSLASLTPDDFVLRDDARRFELYEKNRALTLGLRQAIAYALELDVSRIWQQISHLSYTLRAQLSSIEGITLHDAGEQLSGIVTFTVAGANAGAVKSYLAANGVNVSVGVAKSTPVFMNKHGLTEVVRASLHYYNTLAEIETLVQLLRQFIIVN